MDSPSLFVIFMLVGGSLVVGGMGAAPDQDTTDAYSYSVYNVSGGHSPSQSFLSYDDDETFDYENLSATGQTAFRRALGADGHYTAEGETGRAPEFRFYTDDASSYLVHYEGQRYEVVTLEMYDGISTGSIVALLTVSLGLLVGLCGLVGGIVDTLFGDEPFALQQVAPAVATVVLLLVVVYSDPIPTAGGWVGGTTVGALVFGVTTALLWSGLARLDTVLSESESSGTR